MTFQDAAKVAEAEMRTVFPITPLLRNDHLSAKFGAEIYLKREDLSPVRSYKLRGAFSAMRKVPDAGLFVCASAGNHAQGVAFMCRHFQRKGVVFMPVTTPDQKILKTRMFGGDFIDVRLVGDFFDDTLAEAKAYCENEGGHFLSPFDDEDVIEGQASIAVEISDQLGGVPDHIILPVGGGGLSAGIVSYFENSVQYTFVEPDGAPSFDQALRAGRPVAISPISNFVDGATVAQLGALTFQRLRNVDPRDVWTVSEDRLCVTLIEMLNIEGIVLEPAGALAVDVLQDIQDRIAGKTVVCVTSGGNFDFERLPEVKERALKYSGTKKYFILRMPQRPGALRDFLEILGPQDDIARFEYLKKSARNFGSVLIGIETPDASNFERLFAQLDAVGFAYTDITNDETLAQFVI